MHVVCSWSIAHYRRGRERLGPTETMCRRIGMTKLVGRKMLVHCVQAGIAWVGGDISTACMQKIKQELALLSIELAGARGGS